MIYLLSEKWSFGTTDLINCFVAFFTLLAICVSLYLAQKATTLKFKLLQHRINKNLLAKKQYHQLFILNNGQTKFTLTSTGYFISGKYFFVDFINCLKKLDNTITEQQVHGGQHRVTTETVILPTYIHEGGLLELGLFPADYDFSEIKSKNAKVYIFVIINGKKHKYKTGIKFKEFKNIISSLNRKSLFYENSKKFKSRDIKNHYFR